MRVVLFCPAPRGSRIGNRITALRWQKLIESLGHRVRVTSERPRGGYDLLVALHAWKSASIVRWSRARHPNRRVVVALTGTDLYRDLPRKPSARRALELADRIVALHDRVADDLPRAWHDKLRVIRQSADAPRARSRKRGETFDVALVAHLRAVKDPMRAPIAARGLPATSRLRLVHVGRALSPAWEKRARAEEASNPRYRWLGERSAARAKRCIAEARLLVLTSVMEGGANVLGEAIVCGTPIVASAIPASRSALGAKYPGFFRVGDTVGLRRLLARAESDGAFLARLARATRARRPLFTRAVEKRAWRSLLAELAPG